MRHRLYVCCPIEGCGGFQRTLVWLKSHGIEPAFGLDERGHYFDLRIPRSWPQARRQRFQRQLNARTRSGA
jgi:hypothetical protein